jgi:hypothetical protein
MTAQADTRHQIKGTPDNGSDLQAQEPCTGLKNLQAPVVLIYCQLPARLDYEK